MSSQEKFRPDGSLNVDENYNEAANALRERISLHLADIGLHGFDEKFAIHGFDESEPNKIFDPNSRSYILIYCQPKTDEEQFPSYHIISKEKLTEDSNGYQGQLYRHFGFFPNNYVKLRHYTETVNVETGRYLDDIITGALFDFEKDEEGDWVLGFNPRSLVQVTRRNDDDEIFNECPDDLKYNLSYAIDLMGIITDESVLYVYPYNDQS
jgi:hypothetical protein